MQLKPNRTFFKKTNLSGNKSGCRLGLTYIFKQLPPSTYQQCSETINPRSATEKKHCKLALPTLYPHSFSVLLFWWAKNALNLHNNGKNFSVNQAVLFSMKPSNCLYLSNTPAGAISNGTNVTRRAPTATQHTSH